MKHINQGRSSRGFTLIELMIAITIVAILVAMAVPAYKDYTIRSKIAECVNGAAIAKVQISEYKQTLGPWPPSATDAGLDGAGDSRFCDGFTNYLPGDGSFIVEIDEGAIDTAIVGEIAPRMTPAETASSIINWNCSLGTTPVSNLKYLPSTCRDT